jgi:hypothetical protein
MGRALGAILCALVVAAPARAAQPGVVTGRVYENVYWFGTLVETKPAVGATVVAYPSDPGPCLTCAEHGPMHKASAVSTQAEADGSFRLALDDGLSHPVIWAGKKYGTWFSTTGTPGLGPVTLDIYVQGERAR